MLSNQLVRLVVLGSVHVVLVEEFRNTSSEIRTHTKSLVEFVSSA